MHQYVQFAISAALATLSFMILRKWRRERQQDVEGRVNQNLRVFLADTGEVPVIRNADAESNQPPPLKTCVGRKPRNTSKPGRRGKRRQRAAAAVRS